MQGAFFTVLFWRKKKQTLSGMERVCGFSWGMI